MEPLWLLFPFNIILAGIYLPLLMFLLYDSNVYLKLYNRIIFILLVWVSLEACLYKRIG